MPRTVDEGFRDFLRGLTPSTGETTAAKNHRASIEKCIKSNFGLTRFWQTGSFGNGTSIKGHSDVDYMACIPSDSLHANSSTALAALTKALDKRFPHTDVHTSCPATVVPFGTDISETTEVTPADYLRTTNGFKVYNIPDCSGGWRSASPDAHNSYVRETDNKLSKKVKPLIRFLKAWKYFQSVPISSFYLELRVAKYASNESAIVYSIDVKSVLAHLNSIGLARIQDPMEISGYISPCGTDAQLSTAKSKLSTALTSVRQKTPQVIDSTGSLSDFKWRRSSGCRILGSSFPRIGPLRAHLRGIDIMREVLRSQLQLGEVAIDKVWINPKSRDDIPAVLKGLQHIWCDEASREQLYALLDEHILPEADRTVGRPGMDLWQVLVLGVLKQGLGCDFDRLHELTNHHDTIRAFLGHSDFGDKTHYEYQTVVDNVSLLTPELLSAVGRLVVESGHKVAKKKAWRAIARAV